MIPRIAGVGILTLVAGLVAVPGTAMAQENGSNPVMRAVTSSEITWGEIEVPGFLSGLEISPVHGDPSVADQPYTLRLAFPDGYRFPPHWHPRAENVTVLEGEFRLAMGETYEEGTLRTYVPGDYLYIEAENAHYGSVKGRTVVQLHGMGPFEIHVVEGQEMSN